MRKESNVEKLSNYKKFKMDKATLAADTFISKTGFTD